MANNDKSKVFTPKVKATGVVFVAPIGTELPTDGTSALNEAFVNVGYISEDGITNAVETDFEDIKEMGGEIVDSVLTSRKETWQFTMLETALQSLKLYYGDTNVSGNGKKITAKHNGLDDTSHAFVVEVLYKGNIVERTVIESGKVTEVGDKTYKAGSVVGYDVTVKAAPDANGDTATTYFAEVV